MLRHYQKFVSQSYPIHLDRHGTNEIKSFFKTTRNWTRNLSKKPLSEKACIINNIFNHKCGIHTSTSQFNANSPDNSLDATDVVIVGGGAIGLSTAYWLKSTNKQLNVTVIERDHSYTKASTPLAMGGIRQQFSLPENIKMSNFSATFLKNVGNYLTVPDEDPPDVHFNPYGYLFLANEKGKATMEANNIVQKEEGINVNLLQPDSLLAKFPWLNVGDISIGSYGASFENEGWFDPWLLLTALRSKCASLGVKYVEGEVVGFKEADGNTVGEGSNDGLHILRSVLVKSKHGGIGDIPFALCVNASGAWLADIGKLAGIGTGDGLRKTCIPVELRKRYAYLIHCHDGPGIEMPIVVDTSGFYVRREGFGGHYVCGMSPSKQAEEPDHSNLDVDFAWFHDCIWPALAHRIPAFECIKVVRGWAGYYEFNYFDENLIIGKHPYHKNFLLVGGCSGHGVMQAVAIGRAAMELILYDKFTSIDLSRFSFDRIIHDKPVFEGALI